MNRLRWMAAGVLAFSVLAGVNRVIAETTDESSPAKEALEKGKSLFDEEDYPAAIEALSEAIKLDPKSAEAYCYRGRAYGNNGDEEKGFADVNEAIRLNPDYPLAYSSRAICYAGKRDFDNAMRELREGNSVGPEIG